MDTDWTIILAELLGTDLATIGRVLSWLVAIAIIRTALAKAGVDRGIVAARSWLARRRIAAQATRTGVDDALVHVGSYVLEAAALVLAAGAAVVALVMWLTPHLRIGMALAQQHLEDTQTRRRPPGSLLGMLTWLILALGLVVVLCAPLVLSGCARGSADTTPLHRAGTAVSVLVDTGAFLGAELAREIESEVREARDVCLAEAETGRDCDLVARQRGDEYRVLAYAHNSYATLVNELRDELQLQAERREAGEEPDLATAARLAGRALRSYATLAELLRLVDIPAPELPAGVVSALESLR